MKITKNQHYVPQCLIKNFSTKSDQAVYVYDSGRQKARGPVATERVLSENFFYDRDNYVENFLATHIEAPAALLIQEIIREPKATISNNLQDLTKFINVQISRTPSALETTQKNIEKFATDTLEVLGKLNGFDDKAIESVKFRLDDTKSILALQVFNSALSSMLLSDLSPHIIINNTDTDFILSDHPAVHYNWYLRDSHNLAQTSLSARGVQIFLPISNKLTFCLYDASTYKLGKKGCSYTEANDKYDIALLNRLQLMNRDAYVIYSHEKVRNSLVNDCEKITRDSLHHSNTWYSTPEPQEIAQDETKIQHFTFRRQARIKTWLTFSKVKRKVSKKDTLCEHRNSDLVTDYEDLIKKLNIDESINN